VGTERPAERRSPATAPDPLEDSSAEVEIAEAAIADPEAAPVDELEPDELPAAEDDVLEGELTEPVSPRAARRAARDGEAPVRRTAAAGSGAQLPREGNRLVNFLQASWAELQRVQWPDRRAVWQATAVVVVFVVIAGGYLGLWDVVFSRVVDAIL
jgi:preprotein translocase SecE subunit